MKAISQAGRPPSCLGFRAITFGPPCKEDNPRIGQSEVTWGGVKGIQFRVPTYICMCANYERVLFKALQILQGNKILFMIL